MEPRFWIILPALLAAVLLFGACGQSAMLSPPLRQDTETALPEATREPGFVGNQLISRDAIRPIYDPEFVPADEAGYAEDELVMGVAINGEAKAYPVSVLNGREMVNDELAGTPILVTW